MSYEEMRDAWQAAVLSRENMDERLRVACDKNSRLKKVIKNKDALIDIITACNEISKEAKQNSMQQHDGDDGSSGISAYAAQAQANAITALVARNAELTATIQELQGRLLHSTRLRSASAGELTWPPDTPEAIAERAAAASKTRAEVDDVVAAMSKTGLQ